MQRNTPDSVFIPYFIFVLSDYLEVSKTIIKFAIVS